MEGCTIVPVFNYQGESSGRFCKAHRCGPSRRLHWKNHMHACSTVSFTWAPSLGTVVP